MPLSCLPFCKANDHVYVGPNNTDTKPPTYCPPFPAAQMARLAGQTTPPMGPLEPSICGNKFYCPPGGKEKIQCPAGYYCPQGSYAPIKCAFGANCPKGSYYDRPLLPVALLGFLDLLLVSLVVAAKLLHRKQKKSSRRRSNGIQRWRKTFTFSTANFGSPKFDRLPTDDVHLESRISGVRRAPTGFMAEMDNYYAFEGDDDQTSQTSYEDGKTNPVIQQFVQSLSRCTVASNFGLSFEFENLKFQPNKKSKPILSEVSGQIESGTLWGVMGASGAGKSTFVNVLMGKCSPQKAFTKSYLLSCHKIYLPAFATYVTRRY